MAQVGNANRRAALLAAGEVVGGWGPAPPELDDRAMATLRMADLFVAWLEGDESAGAPQANTAE